VTSSLLAAAPAAALLALGNWGMRNLEDLVPAGASPDRRRKDERSLRRGARSCFGLGALFAVFAVVLGVSSVVGG